MKKGILFLPISKPIRTQIGKEEDEVVLLRLCRKHIPSHVSQELIDCLKDDTGKLLLFYQLKEAEQKHRIEYIYRSDPEEIKANRIIKLLGELKPNS